MCDDVLREALREELPDEVEDGEEKQTNPRE